MRLAWLLVAVLAGCVVEEPALGPEAAPPPALELLGCENLSGNFPVPLDAARAALPSGFEPVEAAGPPGSAIMYIVAAACTGSRVAGADEGDALLVYAELAVEPPAEFASAAAADHTVPIIFAASPARLGEAVAALQLGRAGSADIARDVAPTGTTFHVEMQGIILDITGVARPTPGALDASAFRVFGAQDGALRSVLDGVATDATAEPATLTLRASGEALLEQARPLATGGAVAGYDLTLTRVDAIR